MKTLLRHELRALALERARMVWMLPTLGIMLLWALTIHHWEIVALITLACVEGCLLWAAFGTAIGRVRHEQRDGTSHLWVRLGPPPAARLAAKGLATLMTVAVWFVAVGVLLAAFMAAFRTQLAAQGLRPVLGPAPAIGSTLLLMWHWLPRDIALLFAFAPLFAVAGLAMGFFLGRLDRAYGTKRRGRVLWVATWVAAWFAIEAVAPHLGPLFTVLRAGGGSVVHLVPAGGADVTVAVAPGIAVTIWPILATWVAAAAVFAWTARYAGGDAVRL